MLCIVAKHEETVSEQYLASLSLPGTVEQDTRQGTHHEGHTGDGHLGCYCGGFFFA